MVHFLLFIDTVVMYYSDILHADVFDYTFTPSLCHKFTNPTNVLSHPRTKRLPRVIIHNLRPNGRILLYHIILCSYQGKIPIYHSNKPNTSLTIPA